jgi:MoaA/NifB/PqqE/SkfB family radical SAM enzyme
MSYQLLAMNTMKSLAKFLLGERRKFEAFQVEVSTYSSLECQICTRGVFAEEWIFQNMPLETFRKISAHFPLTRWVFFRGWGDPLENENLLEMLHLAKRAECRTAVTTNGSLLTEEVSRGLLATDPDILVVALELATQEIQEGLAPIGSDLRRILDQVQALVNLRKASGKENPAINLSFPMTRLNMAELPGLVSVAARLGVNELIFNHLDYLPEERWNILRTFYHESPTRAFEESIEEILRQARKEWIPVTVYPLKAEEKPVCEPDPPNRVFFSVDGSIAPCPYLRIPKRGDIPRIFLNQEYSVPQTIFGNIHQEDFLEAWDREPYRSFRKIFEDRRTAQIDAAPMVDVFSDLPPEAESQTPQGLSPPLSELCRTCYKAYGI